MMCDRVMNEAEETRSGGKIEAGGTLESASLPGSLTHALAPEQSLLLDEYFLHSRRQVIVMVMVME